jgi:hypothetical protein
VRGATANLEKFVDLSPALSALLEHPLVDVALGVNAILTPPCILHW